MLACGLSSNLEALIMPRESFQCFYGDREEAEPRPRACARLRSDDGEIGCHLPSVAVTWGCHTGRAMQPRTMAGCMLAGMYRVRFAGRSRLLTFTPRSPLTCSFPRLASSEAPAPGVEVSPGSTPRSAGRRCVSRLGWPRSEWPSVRQ